MTIQRIEVGNTVVCDMCNADFTDKPDTGGFLFGSKAVCPCCAESLEKDLIASGEQAWIKARCPAGTSFAAWVLGLREGRNYIEIRTGEDAFK